MAKSVIPARPDDAIAIQRRYYNETATDYERMHAHEGVRDGFVKRLVEAILQIVGAQSVLDIGTATGQFLCDLRAVMPGAFLCGVEPVPALLDVARNSGALSCGGLICGSGAALPFPDKSFDVVCEFATLHHVRAPNAIVGEMMRVARKAVLIADSNRFGQGPSIARLAKLALYKTGVWSFCDWLRTKGKGYRVTEGDGLAYSYSVYDSYDLLAGWADRLILIPADIERASSWLHPLLTSRGVVACAIKETG